jgi:hypothetical protein
MYLIRSIGEYSHTLVECHSDGYSRLLRKKGKAEYRLVSTKEAHDWVRDGGIHETALYIDSGRAA